MLLSIPSTLRTPVYISAPPRPQHTAVSSASPTRTSQSLATASLRMCRHSLLSQGWRESMHRPWLQARKAWVACTALHDRSTQLRPTPPAPWEPLGHHGPELAHLPRARCAAGWGRPPCGAVLCTIPGGPCSICTGEGTLRSTAAAGEGCKGLGYCREGAWAPCSPGRVSKASPRPLGDSLGGAGQ